MEQNYIASLKWKIPGWKICFRFDGANNQGDYNRDFTVLLMNSFFLRDLKVKTKISIICEQKEFLRWNKKHFSSFLKLKRFLEANKTIFFERNI